MKKFLCLFPILLFLSAKPFAQEKDSIQSSIVRFFDGFSEYNTDLFRNYTTSDFLLLEDGEVWTIDTLVNRMNARKNRNIERINKFQFIKTEQSGNIAWVSYHNTADFKLNDKQQTVKWLESAVLIKEKGRWKLKQLHSTKLK